MTVNDAIKLNQFTIESYTFAAADNNSKLVATFNLKRIFSYHLTNTFLPTSSLLLISEVTLYFSDTKMEVAVGLSLTILLVVYTFYQSISDGVTKTAYLKMIDYWLLFCLLVPLLVFLIEVYWLLNENMKISASRPSNKKHWKRIVTISTLVFIVIYMRVGMARILS